MEAHIEHGFHVCDAGGVEAQRLVESSRILPSPKGAFDHGMHAWPGDGTPRGKGESAAHAACVCVAQLGSVGRRRRRKRTLNMKLMDVTLEVSQLEISTLKLLEDWKR